MLKPSLPQIACFIAYAAQVYIGVALLKALFSLDGAPWYEFREQVQCGVLGALFILVRSTPVRTRTQ